MSDSPTIEGIIDNIFVLVKAFRRMFGWPADATKGGRTLRDIAPLKDQWRQELAKGFTREEIRELDSLMSRLVERLNGLKDPDKERKKDAVLKMRGMGREAFAGVDVDDYVDSLRRDWE